MLKVMGSIGAIGAVIVFTGIGCSGAVTCRDTVGADIDTDGVTAIILHPASVLLSNQ